MRQKLHFPYFQTFKFLADKTSSLQAHYLAHQLCTFYYIASELSLFALIFLSFYTFQFWFILNFLSPCHASLGCYLKPFYLLSVDTHYYKPSFISLWLHAPSFSISVSTFLIFKFLFWFLHWPSVHSKVYCCTHMIVSFLKFLVVI